MKYVDRKEEELRKKGDDEDSSRHLTALEYFILRSPLSKKEVLTLVCDSLLAGTDTVSFTLVPLPVDDACHPLCVVIGAYVR